VPKEEPREKAAPEDDAESDTGPKLLSKKEKEKLKKDKEKVSSFLSFHSTICSLILSRRRKRLKPPQRKPLLPKKPPLPLDPPLQNLQNQHTRNQKPTKTGRTMKKVPPPVPRATKRRKRRSQRRRRSLPLPPRRSRVLSVR